jgi:hypothetical protein
VTGDGDELIDSPELTTSNGAALRTDMGQISNLKGVRSVRQNGTPVEVCIAGLAGIVAARQPWVMLYSP